MIFTDRKITIRNGKSSINEPVILYRGDYEVSIKFTIMESKFRFKSGVNLVDSEKASHGQLAILAPYGGNVFSEIVKCEDGTVTFTLTKEMIDQLEEVGLYSFQIRLFDYYRESRVSIPPVEFGIEVREPVASEDHDNTVNNAIVGYSIAKVTDVLNEKVPETFDDAGNYNKTIWQTGDRISQGKLNKIEDALDKINQNEKNDVAALDKRVTNNYNVLDSNKADKNELNVERSRIDSLTKLPSGSTSGDAELIDIRTDVFGVSNTNAGTAVRNQVKRVYFSNSATVSKTISTINTHTLSFEYKTLGASTLSITLSAPGVLISGNMCPVGVQNLAGKFIDSISRFWIDHNDNTITLKLDYPIQAVRIYIPSNAIAQPGEISLHITEQSLRESIDALNEKMHYIHDVDVQVSKDFSITDPKIGHSLRTAIDIPANTPIRVSIEDDDGVITFDRCKHTIVGGVVDKSSQQYDNIFFFEGRNTVMFQCEHDIQQIIVWISNLNINKTGMITVHIQGKSLPYQLPVMISEINEFRNNTRTQLDSIVNSIGLQDNNYHYGTHDINMTSVGIYSASSILQNIYKANTPIYLSFSGVGASSELMVGCHYKNLGYLASQVSIGLNSTVEFIPPDDFTMFTIYTQSCDVGRYTFEVNSTKEGNISIYELIADSDSKIEHINNTLGYPMDTLISEYEFTLTEGRGISIQKILPGDYKANVPVYIRFESNNGTSSNLSIGCHYRNLGYLTSQVYIGLNSTVEFIPPDDFTKITIWSPSASAGDYRVATHTAPPMLKTVKEEIDDINDKLDNAGLNIKSGSFSIVGDSWSTFKGWIPEGNSPWYPPAAVNAANDVTSAKQTWWWQLADRTGMTLYLNDSWSGSTICGTGYNGSNTLATSAMVTRVKKHMGETKVLEPKPNIIFILAGTNDSSAGSPVGAVQYSDWTESDLMSTLPAFCCMVDYLKTWNPGCRIINVVNPGIKNEIRSGFVTACEHYGIENLVLSGINALAGHPSIAGMKSIADQIIAIL